MQAKPSIALLHGWATNPQIWAPVVAALEANGYPATVYEMSGYGSRSAEQTQRSFQWHVEDSIDKLEQCPIWVGWSLGAMISLSAASRKVSGLKGLVVVSGTAKFCHDPTKSHALLELKTATAADHETAAKRFVRSMPSAQNRRKLIRTLARQTDIASQETLLQGLDLLSRADLNGEVNKIGIPVRIISGTDDLIIPVQSGIELQQQISGSQFAALPCGHIPFLECPEAFMEHLFEFAETIAQSQAG